MAAAHFVSTLQTPLAELVAYLRIYFEEHDTLAEHLSDTQPWKLTPATFTFGERKPKDRKDPPLSR